MNRMFLLAASVAFSFCLAGYCFLKKPAKQNPNDQVIPSEVVRPLLVLNSRR